MYENENIFEFDPEISGFEAEQYEGEQFEYGEAEWGEVFNENEVMELAAELLEISNEAELDQFLGGLIKKVGGAIGKVVKSPIGRAIGGVIKGVAKKALPIAGGALGAYFGGPLGAKIGSGLASAAGGALGLELETLSQEDREFEGGKQFIRFAANTARNALSAPPSGDPRSAAQMAANKAAQIYVPNLTARARTAMPVVVPGKGQGGRWIRRGRNIIILNT
ncbi:hypothetical protein [Nitrosomonas sp.]|uniref:hypothetical protein n=1 Tax=Nitrosomonas sp. TaxID=42353 RepID=UPI0025D7BAC8|nr:hypothetical protein [Nitrosomonas sp.]MCC6916812.1 hypothetical protein [Nitrosomonas sp.]